MPIARPDRRRPAGVILAALLATTAVGCSGDEPSPSPGSEKRERPREQPSAAQLRVPDVARDITRALDRRAAAILSGERKAFLDGVAVPERKAQATYFDNLSGALPVGLLDYELDRRTLVRDGRGYWVEVDVSLQLEEYDEVPVVTRDRYRFVRGPGARFRVASTTDEAWELQHDTFAQPWETGPVTVVAGSHTLGIFDAGSAGGARRVVGDVEAGIAAVAAQVPYAWDRRVVVYALSQGDFLAGLPDLPGDDPLALDAVALPVPARQGSNKVADTRVVLNPRMVTAPGPARSRLIRHELTHVALGARQDVAPTWFSEGLAEYVSVQAIAPEDRALSGAALDAAEAGFEEMPVGDTFNGRGYRANYGLSWWACEYLVATYDESVLWRLLESMTTAEESDAVLRRVVGIGEKRLARKAGELMLRTYRQPEPEKKPSKDPSDGSSDKPSDKPSDGSDRD